MKPWILEATLSVLFILFTILWEWYFNQNGEELVKQFLMEK